MKNAVKTIATGAAATVVSGFAIYAASPHFDEALQVVVRWVTTPIAWACLFAVWVGLFCVQQWWSSLQFGMHYERSGWGTAVWFFLGAGLTAWGSYTLYSLALAV